MKPSFLIGYPVNAETNPEAYARYVGDCAQAEAVEAGLIAAGVSAYAAELEWRDLNIRARDVYQAACYGMTQGEYDAEKEKIRRRIHRQARHRRAYYDRCIEKKDARENPSDND